MSKRHRRDRPPLPQLSPTQIMQRDARRLCHVAASASGAAPTWLTIGDITARARSGTEATRLAITFATNRGWLRLESGGTDRVMLTRLGVIIASDQRVDPKRRRSQITRRAA